MNRSHRKRIAEETLAIIGRGWYENSAGEKIDIAGFVARGRAHTCLFRPEELSELYEEEIKTDGNANSRTKFLVTNETTLSAARRITSEVGDGVACLNFASAKNPGGGFLGGSQAQEESLARSSSLYDSLLTQPEYYEANRAQKSPLYTDHIINSPDVVVIRDDHGALLDRFYTINIVTVPAVNAGALERCSQEERAQRATTLARRMNYLLEICRRSSCGHLILGAWGCGVFRNDPIEVAKLFGDALKRGDRFLNCFRTVCFAVLDTSQDQAIFRAFQAEFAE